MAKNNFTDSHTPQAKIRLAVLGDLMLITKAGAAAPDRGLECLSAELLQILSACDVVFANLECTLPAERDALDGLLPKEAVPTEPLVLTTEKQMRTVTEAGIRAVTLGNNHMFDCLDAGFQRTTRLLDEMEVLWCGAGRDLEEACQPAITEINGISLAFIGAVDNSSGAYRFADPVSSGVAPLDTEDLCKRITKLKNHVNHIIVSPHWGEERFRIPSPKQQKQARAFIDAGAGMVLGHHPHVLQGMEYYRGKPIVYSLGNFFANPVHWTRVDDVLHWNRYERTGCLFVAELDETNLLRSQRIPTFDDGRTIGLHPKPWGKRHLRNVDGLLKRDITPARYRREAFRVCTVKPILAHLHWSRIGKLRFSHLSKGLGLIFRRNEPV